jgi:phosphoglycolate phosphatase
VLWDIDRTLIFAGGLGRAVYAAAFAEVTGRELRELPDMAGRTDHDLVVDVLAAHEVPHTDTIVADFFLALERASRAVRDAMLQRGRVLPGVPDALAALAARPEVIQTLVTGNIRAVALDKVSMFGLDGSLDLTVGAYGCDGGVRSRLVTLARERVARRHGVRVPDRHVVVIGDSPRDVAAAHGAGVRAVAVATGSSTAADLAATGADLVLPDLTDTGALLSFVLAD